MVYVFLAEGFEEIEALAVVDILRRADLPVTTVGVGGETIKGTHGIAVMADVKDTDVCLDNAQAVILPGGMPGTLHLEESAIVQAAIRAADKKHICIGAICAAPSVLGHAGLLKGKRATCYPGFEDALIGATVVADAVVADDHIVTAKGAGCAIEFALKLVEILVSAGTANKLKESMQCL